MPKPKKYPKPDLFAHRERLREIVRDLENIDRLIPVEASRIGCSVNDPEAAAIIEARKRDLLGYVQTVCRDHILWTEKLLGGKDA